jgi:hypothetical protein
MAAAGGGRARPPRARAARTAESRGSTSGRRRRGEDEEREEGDPTYDVGDNEDLAEEDDDAQAEESEDEDDDDDDDNDDDDDEDEDDEDGDADADEDDDESPFKFLERLDPNWLTRRSYPQAALSAQPSSAIGVDGRSPAGGADDAEFYAAMIQMLTHVLGSSDSIGWASQVTPGSQLAPSPFAHPQSSPAQTPNHAGASHAGPSRSTSLRSKNELSALQPLIQALIARLGKDQQVSRRPVGEQDLTALLQTLMEQQQRQQQQHSQRQGSDGQAAQVFPSSNYQFAQPSLATQAASDSALGRSHPQTDHTGVGFGIAAQDAYRPLHFADLDFEDEDEDDPDFNPDLNPDLPLPSAWSLAVRDVVASEKSRAAAAAVAASHSGTPSGSQTPAARRGSYREGDPHPHAHLFPHPTSFATEADRPPAREPSTHASTSVGEANEGLTTAEHIDTHATAEAVRAASATQSEPEQGEQSIPRKRGRKPVLEPGEAQRRRAQRNVEYQRMRRQVKKAEESEQSEAVLELRAEVKMLRAEMERLRDENAMLRAQRELDRLQRSNRR